MPSIIHVVVVNVKSLNSGSPRVWLQSSQRNALEPQAVEVEHQCPASKYSRQNIAFFACTGMNLNRPFLSIGSP